MKIPEHSSGKFMHALYDGPDLKALANGSVRARHFVILFTLVYFLAFAGAYWLSSDVDPLYRPVWRACIWQLGQFASFTLVTACVPEVRRLFFEVMQGGARAAPTDILITIAVMVTWGLGVSRILFQYPLVLYDADAAYRFLNLGAKPDPGPIYLLLGTLSAVLFAPVCEEIIFRGYLMNLWLARHKLWFAVWASSIFFGLWHFKTAPFATGMGVILALVYWRYHSLVLCMVLHALYNLLMNRLLLGRPFIEKERATVTDVSSWSIELALAIAFIPLAWIFWKRFRPQSGSNS